MASDPTVISSQGLRLNNHSSFDVAIQSISYRLCRMSAYIWSVLLLYVVSVLRFENVVFPDHIGFKCKGCGRCCTEQPADVTAKERAGIEAKGFTGFLDENDLTEPRLIRSRKDGGCFFLTASNGCAVNDAKPAICQLVPFVVVDWDYERNLIEVDLPADCECPGVFGGSELPLESLVKAAQTYVRDLIEAVAKQESLSPNDPKVLSKTRQLIIRQSTDPEA